MIPDRDCTLAADLRNIGKLKHGVIDCNRLTGIGVSDDEYDEVLAGLAAKGWRRVGGERGGPEGISTSYLDNPTVPRSMPYRSPEMADYLANR